MTSDRTAGAAPVSRGGAGAGVAPGPGAPPPSGLLVFLLIAFGGAWTGVLVARLLGASLANPVVQLPMAFAPALAAVVVRRWVTREGFGDAGLAPRVRAARRYYVVALVGPVLVVVATVALAVALGLYRPDLAALARPVSGGALPGPLALLGLLVSPVLAMPIFWGEEFGWRSYLQPRAHRRPLRAAVITGLIWAVWHYPLAFTDYVEYANPFVGIASWTLLSVPLAVILAWLYLRSGTVWVPCLAHAGNNLILGTLSWALLIDDGGLDPTTVDVLTAVPLIAVCAWLVRTGRVAPAAPAAPVVTAG